MSEQPNPAPEPAPTTPPAIPKKPMLHSNMWKEFGNGLKKGFEGFGKSIAQIIEVPSLLAVYPLSFAYAMVASVARLLTIHKPEFHNDMAKATNAFPEWLRFSGGLGMIAYAIIAL